MNRIQVQRNIELKSWLKYICNIVEIVKLIFLVKILILSLELKTVRGFFEIPKIYSIMKQLLILFEMGPFGAAHGCRAKKPS